MAVNDEDRGLDAAEEEILDNLKSELSKKRESLLKAEIRRIQTESAQAEKKCRASMAEERRRVQDARDTEEEQLSRKQVGCVCGGVGSIMRGASQLTPLLFRIATPTRLQI